MGGLRRRDFLGAAASVPVSLAGETVAAIEIMLPVGLLRLRGSHGVEGYYLGVNESAAQAIINCAPALTSSDSLDRERIWRDLVAKRVPVTAITAIDVALWDLAGKALGMPVFRVAGGLREQIPACRVGSQSSRIEEVVQQARQARNAGWPAFKDQFSGPEDAVLAMAKAVRDASGGDVALIHAGGGRYDRPQALRVGRALEKSGYELLEEPLPAGDRDGVGELARTLDISISAAVSRSEVARSLAAQSPDVLRIEAAGQGGFTGLLKSLRAAEAFGVTCSIAGRGPMGGLVHGHATGAVRAARFLEDSGLAEESPLTRASLPAGPEVRLPAAPGFGLELNWPEVERRTKRVLRS